MTRQSGDRQFNVNKRFDRLESMIGDLGRFMSLIANHEYRRDMKQMFDFSRMNASIAKIGDIAASVKAAYDGVVIQRDEARAERDRLIAENTGEAEQLATAEANLAAAEAMLETLRAVAEGTPVVLPPAEPPVGGQSTGGANPAVD